MASNKERIAELRARFEKSDTLQEKAKNFNQNVIEMEEVDKDSEDFNKLAEEAFQLLDIDENGWIERGDIEILFNLYGIEDIDNIADWSGEVMATLDEDESGKVDMEEFKKCWPIVKENLDKLRAQSGLQGVDAKNLKSKMETASLPLYAMGNKLCFFRREIYDTENAPEADCVFFGSPYDATTAFRMGARFGPQAVRQASQLVAFNYSPYHDRSYDKMKIYDAGDAVANPFNIMVAMNQCYLYAKKLWNTSKKVIGIGGDHSLSWCILRAARDHTGGPVALINLDAHYDTVDEYAGERLTHGTALRRAMDDGCIDMARAFHVGMRGSLNSKKMLEEDKRQGWTTFTQDDVDDLGPVEVAKRIKEQIGDVPTIVSLDMDVMEPGEAPGCGFLECGGMSSRQLLRFLRALYGLNVVGGEVCELAPEYDTSNTTSQVAACGAYEIMCLALADVPEPEEA